MKTSLIVQQFPTHRPVNFASLTDIFKIIEALILSANTANIEQLSWAEKLSGLSRNTPRTEKWNVDASIPRVTETMKVSFCFEGTAPLGTAAPSFTPCKQSLSLGFSFLAYQSRKTVRIRSHRL